MQGIDTHVHTRTGNTVDTFKRALLDNLYYVLGKDQAIATPRDYYMALAYTVRDRMIQRWLKTLHAYSKADAKTVYYLSAEYLLGRQLANNLLNEKLTAIAREALSELGLSLDDLCGLETEPGLGNGGLGRLAACFLDSLATLDQPAVGYGIRYEFGIFRQSFENGWQIERPDDWLYAGNPWEFPHPDSQVEVGFGGRTQNYTDDKGRYRVRWFPEHTVLGVPYNMMVPGYATDNVNTLRLWSARASASFNLQVFNSGDYTRAVEEKTFSENISKVLYPDDTTPQGKQLRLQQQYFFVACSLRDIVRGFLARHDNWQLFPEKVVIQLNDTHPTIAVAELQRMLVDEYLLEWDEAWAITSKTFGYTCHTLMPEALECWPVGIFERLLPRHLEIIYEINTRFLRLVRSRYPGDVDRIARVSIIGEWPEKQVRMAHLAVVGSFSVNGVAALHSDLLRQTVLSDFYALWPEKFNNKTNGVTPRRFVKLSNPHLSDLIERTIGPGWLTNLDLLQGLEACAEDASFREEWRGVKWRNKQELATIIRDQTGVAVDPGSIFDIMVKRLHEYKRQLLKALHIITLYNRIKADPTIDLVPRTVIFGAKAAPGYRMAKLIIRMINGIAGIVNHDPDTQGRLAVAFLPNFNVSLAERIYPAADLSEQISLAGKEASGTGNMKFALNGAVTIGTLDGANVEIRELVGPENFFLFGLTTDEVFDLRAKGYSPHDYYDANAELKRAIDLISLGHFAGGDQDLFKPIVDGLLYHDPFMLMADYQAYIDCQDTVEHAYRDVDSWTRMSILNTARCGFFSSDRSMRQYSEEIWNIRPVKVILED